LEYFSISEQKAAICNESNSFTDYTRRMLNQCIGYFYIDSNETHQLLVSIVAILTIIFVSLANKAIKRDEDLIRSADRLR